MEHGENRRILVSGELPPEGWQMAIYFLGQIGLTVEDDYDRSALPPQAPEPAPKPINSRQDELPYLLQDIDTPDKYVTLEHVEQFWPSYRRQKAVEMSKQVSRADAFQGFKVLYRPLGRQERDIDPETLTIAEYKARGLAFGLKIALPRTEVGFPAEYVGSHTRFIGKQALGAIEVGSFIEFSRDIKTRTLNNRPYRLYKHRADFIDALGNQLQRQLA